MGTLDAGGAPVTERMRVIVIGAGYVGATSATVLAYLGHEVTCVERDPARLRHSVERGRAYGGEAWTRETAARPGLESCPRPPGRPRKERG